MELAANEQYFIPGKPGVSKLDFIFFADPAASVDALRGGQVDLAMRMPTPLFQLLQQEPGIRAIAVPTNGFDLVRLRSDREPGNKPEVIEALKLATDRQAIFETITLGLGAVGRDSPIGPLYTAYYYNEDTPSPPATQPRPKNSCGRQAIRTGSSSTSTCPTAAIAPTWQWC